MTGAAASAAGERRAYRAVEAERRARAAGATAFAAGAGLVVAGVARARRAGADPPAPIAPPARGLLTAAALLSGSVFADSALEHYRGGFRNPGMFAPLVTAGATLATTLRPSRGAPLRKATMTFGAATLVGAAGLGFHIFNVHKRPGRFNWLNLFYAAPLGAPAALTLAGLLGLAAQAVAAGRRRIAGVQLGRGLAALVATGLAGTVGEAGLLHFRGAFQNPFMWLPVTLPPVGAALLGRAAAEVRPPAGRPLTRGWLAAVAALGVAGVGFHVYGVSRAMGGWRNWRQNMVDGPPIPAPPAFSALAVAGLAALRLRDLEAAT